MSGRRIPIFDFDGTLIDSDEALRSPLIRLGVPEDQITFGDPVGVFCERVGISLQSYVDAYDTTEAQLFDGVAEVMERLERWAICSNKASQTAHAELARLGWSPEVVMCAEDFDLGPKRIEPVLDRLGISAEEAWYVGDTAHDEATARAAGVDFAWAGWNPRAVAASLGGRRLRVPSDILSLDGIGFR